MKRVYEHKEDDIIVEVIETLREIVFYQVLRPRPTYSETYIDTKDDFLKMYQEVRTVDPTIERR
jgi:hypothetical protein